MILEKYFTNNSVYLSIYEETIYRFHNSQTAGHLGIKATIQEFRERFYYPGFTEHFCETWVVKGLLKFTFQFKYVLSGIDVFTQVPIRSSVNQ